MPTISAVITAYQFERFIEVAVASVQRQTRRVDEIVVVDNQSTDATPLILERLAGTDARIKLVDVPPHSPARARNHGMRLATGDYIGILDGDDAWPIDKMELQGAALDANPEAQLVAGLTTFVEAIHPQSLKPPAGSRVETALNAHIGSCLFRRALLEKVGAFDDGFRYGDDVDMLLRIRDADVRSAFVDRAMLYHRRYQGSLLTTNLGDERKAREMARAAGLSVVRRRRLGLPAASPLFDWLRA